VDDIRLLEVNGCVAAGMGRAPVPRADRLVPDRDAPVGCECDIGQRHRRLAPLRGVLLILTGTLVGDDLPRRGAHDAVAAGVIGMMVAVDHHIDLPRRALLQAVEEVRCRVRELRVHHHDAAAVDQPADRSAALVEDADVAAQRGERRSNRRRGRLLSHDAARQQRRGGSGGSE
jgi:hypothetical protein